MAHYITDAYGNLIKVAGNYSPMSMSNPNLLINGDFRVNQRGQTSYTVDNKYTVDRWLNRETSMSVTPLTNGGIKLERTATAVTAVPMISQSLEMFENLLGKTLTLTIKVSEDNTVNGFEFGVWGGTQARYATKDYGSSVYLKGTGIHTVTLTLPTIVDYERLNVCIRLKQDSSQGENIVVDWIKLENGSITTPFNPRLYGEELTLCQRYYYMTSFNINASAASSTTQLYPEVFLPTSFRAKPTVNCSTGFSIRGAGVEVESGVTNITVNTAWANTNFVKLLVTTTKSMTKFQCYSCHNGTLEFDAEIY